MTDVRIITTAYEQGVGQALQDGAVNPYAEGDGQARLAWDIGREFGRKRAAQAVPLTALRDAAESARAALSHLLMTRDPLVYSDALRKLDAVLQPAQAAPLTEAWAVIAPDGQRYTGTSAHQAANAANRARRTPEEQAEADARYAELIFAAEAADAEMYAHLNCPACGGSGHVDDINSSATRDVLAERRRQVDAEGWTPEHDDEHDDGAMAQAAGCYALWGRAYPVKGMCPAAWPWHAHDWKPETHRANCVRAAALLLAEIERLDRAAHGITGDQHGR